MIENVINMNISLTRDGKLNMICKKQNRNQIWDLEKNKDIIKRYFDELYDQTIIKCFNKNEDCILYIQNDKGTPFRIKFNDYDRILKVVDISKIDKKINKFYVTNAIKKIKEKLNIKINTYIKKMPNQFVLAGSILTASIMIPSIVAANNNQQLNNNNITEKPIINIVEEIPIEKNNTIDEIVIDNDKVSNDTDKNIISNIQTPITKIDNLEEKKEENNNNNNNNNIDFSELASYNSTEQYISFASKLFGVDIETCNKLLSDKVGNMESYMNNYNDYNLKNLYELKSLGIINGDLDTMGIFVIIKEYANNNLKIYNEEPIISNKTPKDKEKDLVNIAKYIYGIDNENLLSTIIAIHRLETGHDTSTYSVQFNNMGGNMNPAPSEDEINRFMKVTGIEVTKDTPIPNIYKTVEIGEESMIRNFLNVYKKCLQDEECLKEDNVIDFLSRKYCTHTPKDWATTLHGMLQDESILRDVNDYLNINNKTI